MIYLTSGSKRGDIILFVSSNEGVSRHETLQLFLFLFPLQRIKRPALQNKQVVVLRMAFRARKVLGTFEKRPPGLKKSGARIKINRAPGLPRNSSSDPGLAMLFFFFDQKANPRIENI